MRKWNLDIFEKAKIVDNLIAILKDDFRVRETITDPDKVLCYEEDKVDEELLESAYDEMDDYIDEIIAHLERMKDDRTKQHNRS